MKGLESLKKMFMGAVIDGVYFSSTVVNINFFNSLLIEDNEINSFWFNFDCNARIYNLKDESFIDHLTEDIDFISTLYTLIGSEINSAAMENEKLILTFINDIKLEIYEDLEDDNEEIWSICSTLKSSYGEWLFAYFKGGVLKTT